MAEDRVTKNAPAQGALRAVESDALGRMIPFGRFFGVNPFALMQEFTRDMERMFSGFPHREMALGTWSPTIEMNEAEGNLVVTAELAGVKPEDVKVEVTNDALTIEGERKQETTEEKKGFYRSQRTYGRFYRSIVLPEGSKTDQIKADMNKGILEIMVPLADVKPKSKQIPVNGGEAKKEPEAKPAAA